MEVPVVPLHEIIDIKDMHPKSTIGNLRGYLKYCDLIVVVGFLNGESKSFKLHRNIFAGEICHFF